MLPLHCFWHSMSGQRSRRAVNLQQAHASMLNLGSLKEEAVKALNFAISIFKDWTSTCIAVEISATSAFWEGPEVARLGAGASLHRRQ